MFRWIKKYLPSRDTLKRHRSLQPFQKLTNYPELWKLNIDTVSKGVAIGFFTNFIPVPPQMLWAALLAIFFRANLPIAVAISWINNPFTFVPLNFLTYQVGAWIIGKKNQVSISTAWHWDTSSFEGFWHSFVPWFSQFGKAYLIGLPILSLGAAFIGYWVVQSVWKFYLWKRKKTPPTH